MTKAMASSHLSFAGVFSGASFPRMSEDNLGKLVMTIFVIITASLSYLASLLLLQETVRTFANISIELSKTGFNLNFIVAPLVVPVSIVVSLLDLPLAILNLPVVLLEALVRIPTEAIESATLSDVALFTFVSSVFAFCCWLFSIGRHEYGRETIAREKERNAEIENEVAQRVKEIKSDNEKWRREEIEREVLRRLEAMRNIEKTRQSMPQAQKIGAISQKPQNVEPPIVASTTHEHAGRSILVSSTNPNPCPYPSSWPIAANSSTPWPAPSCEFFTSYRRLRDNDV